MAKQSNWLNEQFKAARSEVQSWSPSKQTTMKNALRSKNLKNEGKSTKTNSKGKEAQT